MVNIIKIIRRILAFPILLLSILGFYMTELIAGEKYTWRGDMVRAETMILQNRKKMLKQQLFNRNVSRRPIYYRRKKRRR